MFYLHLSNRTENLISHLAEVLRQDQGRDPLSPEYFLIQSQGMERMLSQRLADSFVSWCNYQYMLPTRFFGLMADRLGVAPGAEDYAREKVCWHLEKILREVSGEEFSLLARYVSGESSGLKRYQLARQLAHVFDQYQIMRLTMIDDWERGRLARANHNPAQAYQMKLWRLLVREVGHCRHRGVFLRDLGELLRSGGDFSAILPSRLSVFGLHSLPPLLLNCLQALALHCDVHFYLLSPCENYWLEQRSPRAQLGQKVEGHPLLSSLGQQGREFQEMLLQQVQFAREFSSFEDPMERDEPLLLHRLQSDLLQGEVTESGTPCHKDESLVVVSAHSPQRELMILKDRILHWLDSDPELTLRDMVVMAPDIQEYSGLIPALFHDIPHSLADRNPSQQNRFIAVYLQFLHLCTSRFGWSEVLDLLEREEIYPRFELADSDLELIRHWVLSSGIRWGLAESEQGELGLAERKECTWQSGIERLMMGYAAGGDEVIDGILPYADIEGSMATPLGGLSLFMEILEQARDDFTESHNLLHWSRKLADYADRIFVVDGTDSLQELHGLLSSLETEYGRLHREPLDFQVIRSWLESAATEKKSSSGFLRGQLTFCSMLPMRSIPFEKVCLLGLNDTAFPKNDRHPPFDLLGDDFLPGDRSRRSDDRYQFLEAILSARSSLYLSYVGQSIRSNDELVPSVVLSELLELCQGYGLSDLVDRHPLHGFSSRYFRQDSPFFSYDRQLCDVARKLQERGSLPPPEPWWQGELEGEVPTDVHLADFLRFFAGPQRYFVRNVLGLRLEQGVQLVDEHEPFVLDPLQNYLVEQDMVTGSLRGIDDEKLRHRLQTEGQWPLGTPGTLSFEKKRAEQHSFVGRVAEQTEGGRLDDCFVDLQIGGVRLSGILSSLYADGPFIFRYAKLKAKDVLSAWIHHCLARICTGEIKESRLLTSDMELLFPGESGGREDLETLMHLFLGGQRAPSPLLLEPAMAYVRQREKTEKSGRGNPLAKALASYENSLNRGMAPEWELLFRGQEPEDILGAEFVELCDWLYESVWCEATVKERD